METKKKKRVLNILTVILSLTVIACAVIAAGQLKGWFGKAESDETGFFIEKVSGIVYTESSGVSYRTEAGQNLRPGDAVDVRSDAQAVIASADGSNITAGGGSRISMSADGVAEPEEGEFLLCTDERLRAIISGTAVDLSGGCCAAEVHKGSLLITVFSGEAAVSGKDVNRYTVKAGNSVSVSDSGEKKTVFTEKAELEDISPYILSLLIGHDGELCFSQEELTTERDTRENAPEETDQDVPDGADDQGRDTEPVENKADSGSAGSASKPSAPEADDKENTDEADAEQQAQEEEKELTCTIRISCSSILDNMDSLKEGKEPYVPSSGTILSSRTVTFNEGDTVFDVLKRVCSSKGIQLEYSWSAVYGSYYVEGIGNLYEFDCGPMSGWRFSVNGWYPNYGCSSYTLSDGDSIAWIYYCG